MTDDQGTAHGPSTGDFEIVGNDVARAGGASRRWLTGAVVAAVTASAVGGGFWAWQAWTAQGDQPAHALPASTLAYVAVDLDPPGEQKVAAYRTLRKFPSLKRHLGAGSVEDVQRSVVQELTTEGDCKLDFVDEVRPWIGSRAAFAVVSAPRPEPVVVLQVKDADKARTGLRAASRRCADSHFGYAVDGGWAVLARNNDVAHRVQQATAHGRLEDDKDFRRITARAGEPGIATLYAAPQAGRALLDAMERDPGVEVAATEMLNVAGDPMNGLAAFASLILLPSFTEEGAASSIGPASDDVPPELRKEEARLNKRFEHFDELSKPEQRRLVRQQERLFRKIHAAHSGAAGPAGSAAAADPGDEELTGSFDDALPKPEVPTALRSSLEDFSGLGGVLRFDDGTLELEVSGDAVEGLFGDVYSGDAGDDVVSELPADTAIAYGAGFGDGWTKVFLDRLHGLSPYGVAPSDKDATAAFEKATGLDVPGDLEALGGTGFSIVAGSGFSPDALDDDVADAPVAVRIAGDADRIEAALDKLRARLGTRAASYLQSRRVGGDVVVGPSRSFLDHLADGHDQLSDAKRFRDLAPEAANATTVLYVDFDAGDWFAKLGSRRDRADLEPVDAFAMTVTKDHGREHVLARLGFDD